MIETRAMRQFFPYFYGFWRPNFKHPAAINKIDFLHRLISRQKIISSQANENAVGSIWDPEFGSGVPGSPAGSHGKQVLVTVMCLMMSPTKPQATRSGKRAVFSRGGG